MLRRSSRARQIVRTLIVASICLTAVQATAAGSSPASQSERAAENAQVLAAESAASALGLGAVKWDRKAFYTRDAMEKWLRSRGLKYRSWAKAHTAAAARLMKNSVVANRRPPAPAPKPKPPAPAPTPPPAAAPHRRRRLRPLRLLLRHPRQRRLLRHRPLRLRPLRRPSAGTCTDAARRRVGGGAKGSIGVAAGGGIVWYDDAKLAKELDGYAAVGAKWIRFDLAWSAVERQQGVYDWAVYDRFVAKARERGLNMIAMVGYTPTWARVAGGTDDKFPPKNVADYGSFAQKAVERYAPKGLKVYELWNEPNLGCCFWKPKADAVRYTELVKAAYGRMKSVDPSITVLTGGTSPADTTSTSISPPRFLQEMYANGVKGHFDGVAHHPYYGPHPISSFKHWSSWSQMMFDTDRGKSLRNQMVENGDGAKKIWASEANMLVESQCIDGFCATEQRQAEMIKEAIDAWRSYPWAGVMTMYNYYGHDGLSLVRSDWSPTPAWFALRDYGG